METGKLREPPHPSSGDINTLILKIYLFLVVLEFELRVSHLLSKASTTWLTPSAFFALGYFSDGILHFCLASLVPPSSHLVSQAQVTTPGLFVEMGSY
jgi:hypothetical protein